MRQWFVRPLMEKDYAMYLEYIHDKCVDYPFKDV